MTPKRLSSASDHSVTYPSLQRELKRRAGGSMITGGPGGLLVFMWTVGAAVVLVVLSLPLLMLPLTAAAIGIGVLMFRDYVQDPAVIARLVPAVVRDLCPAPIVSDLTIEAQLEQARQLFAEIALKVIETTRGDRDPGRSFLIGQAGDMLALQHDLAGQVSEFDRVLGIVGQTSAEPATLLATNTAALRREAEQSAAFIAEIVEQMQTLLLQITQLGVRAVDQVRAAEFTRHARESLDQTQAEVSTRQAVADRVIADLANPTQMTWVSAEPIEKGR